MLRSLRIKNFAVIEDVFLELSPGLNVLTGETGAGKSILIEALGFILGGRGSAQWLRSGANRLEVEAVFDAENFPKEVRARFNLGDLPVALKRELDAAGKTKASINGQNLTAAVLSEIGENLLDFHGQHEHQSLMKNSMQLEMLDRSGGLELERNAVEAAFDAWSALRSEIESAQLSDEERAKRADLLRFQIQEIDKASPKAGEDEELESVLPRLKNADRLKTFIAAAYEILYEQEGSVASSLLKVERSMMELARIDDSLGPLQERMGSARLELEEVARALSAYRGRLDSEPAKVDAVLNRLELFSLLKRKYGPTLADVLQSRERAAQELSRLDNSQERSAKLEVEFKNAAKKLDEACAQMHQARRRSGKKLEAALSRELRALGLQAARFSVSVEMEEGQYFRTGADTVEFMLCANPGEPVRPLKAVASGGELSRLMLAIKTVLANADHVPILVFDEVDAGVGGVVARAVGQKLSDLGRTHQVLCVTHLPQVACWAKAHYLVTKEIAQGRTRTVVELLAGNKRLEAIALMLGGREATAASRKHAQELLESSVA